MKAISFDQFGAPDVLHEVTLPDPTPGPRDVVVRVHTAGVCHHDVLHRAGKLPGAKAGVVLGHEIAGTIVAVGSEVTTHKVDDRVVVYQREFCGVCRHCLRGRMDMCSMLGKPAVDTSGGYSEFVCVPAVQTLHVPEGVPLDHAALASCPIATSLRALRAVAGINPGDTVLVTGASGGLGVHQLQLIRALGGKSIAVTSSEAKADSLRNDAFGPLHGRGADEVVVSPNLDFSRAVWEATGKRGVDIVLDNIGQTLAESLRCLTPGGIAVVLGNISAAPAPVLPGLLIGRRLRVTGSGMGTYEDIRQALAMMEQGSVTPVVDSQFSMPQAAEAHALIESRGVQGRVVLHGW